MARPWEFNAPARPVPRSKKHNPPCGCRSSSSLATRVSHRSAGCCSASPSRRRGSSPPSVPSPKARTRSAHALRDPPNSSGEVLERDRLVGIRRASRCALASKHSSSEVNASACFQLLVRRHHGFLFRLSSASQSCHRRRRRRPRIGALSSARRPGAYSCRPRPARDAEPLAMLLTGRGSGRPPAGPRSSLGLARVEEQLFWLAVVPIFTSDRTPMYSGRGLDHHIA